MQVDLKEDEIQLLIEIIEDIIIEQELKQKNYGYANEEYISDLKRLQSKLKIAVDQR